MELETADDILQALKTADISEVPSLVYRSLNSIKDAEGISTAERNRVLLELIMFLSKVDNAAMFSKKCRLEAEGNTILHFMFTVKQVTKIGNALLNMYKMQSELLLLQFNVALVLSVSQISRFREQALELLKSTYLNRAREMERILSCAWLRCRMKSAFDFDHFFVALIENCSSNNWDYAPEGLRDLGFTFLDTYLHKVTIVNGNILSDSTNRIAHIACRWGEKIIIECYKRHQPMRSALIEQVLDSIFLQTSSALYYVEILSQFVSLGIQGILENKKKIWERIDNIHLLSSNVAVPFLKALVPLFKLKPDLREHLVLVLKNTLFSKDLEGRKTAIGGFLLFLRYFQIMDVLNARYQSQSQTFPTFSSQALQCSSAVETQKSLYEKLCLEIVCCLRKGFSQQGEVRSVLYSGLYNAARKNIKILPAVMDLLLKQLDLYLETDQEKMPPIKLDRCVCVGKVGVQLMEPLGCLIQTIIFCLKLYQASSDSLNLTQNTQRAVFSGTITAIDESVMSLVKRMCKSELEEFQLDKSADYSSDSVEGAKNALLAFQLLAVYEALIEFCYMIDRMNQDTANLILELQGNVGKLADVLREKCVTNSGKKIPLNQTMGTIAKHDQEANKSGQRKSECQVTVRLHTLVPFLERMFTNADQDESNEGAWTLLRTSVDFVRWVLNAAQSLVLNLKNAQTDQIRPFDNLILLNQLLCLLYNQDKRISEDFDRAKLTFVHEKALEIIGHIVDVVCSRFKENIAKFLDTFMNPPIDGETSMKVYKTIRMFVKILIRSLTLSSNEESEEKKVPRQLVSIIKIIEALLKFLPNQSGSDNSKYFGQIYNLLLQICESQDIKDPSVSKSLWALLLQMQIEIEEEPRKLILLTENLLKIYGGYQEDEAKELDTEYRSVNPKTSNAVLLLLLNSLDILNECTCCHIVNMKHFATIHKQMAFTCNLDTERAEVDCCEMLLLLLSVWKVLLCCAIPIPLSDNVIRSLQKYYATLSKFTQYLILLHQKRPNHDGTWFQKFDGLAKLSGTQLTPTVYKFLTYLQEAEIDRKKRNAANPSVAKSKVIKEMKFHSSLVLHLEQYEKGLIQLSAKCKRNFMQGARLGANRDFRIDDSKVKRVLDNEDLDREEADVSASVPVTNETDATALNTATSQKKKRLKTPANQVAATVSKRNKCVSP